MGYGRTIGGNHNHLAQECRNLMGIALGLIADTELNDQEVRWLSEWLQLNQNITYEWPGDILFSRVQGVLADGHISEEERQHLIETLKDICGGPKKQAAPVNQLAFDADAQIVHSGFNFCVTGDFVFGPRTRVVKAISDLGGAVHERVTRKLHYLVVGLQGSQEWKHGSYGDKIQKAIQYKRKGLPIYIVSEDRWASTMQRAGR